MSSLILYIMLATVWSGSPGTQFCLPGTYNLLGEVSVDRRYPVPTISRPVLEGQGELFFNAKSRPFTLGNAKAEVVKQI